jgi:hypothetical protein
LELRRRQLAENDVTDGLGAFHAEDGVDLRDFTLEFATIPLSEATRDNNPLYFTALFQLDSVKNGVDAFLLRGLNKGAGVDDDDVGISATADELAVSARLSPKGTHHFFGIDVVFWTSELDETNFGHKGIGHAPRKNVARHAFQAI